MTPKLKTVLMSGAMTLTPVEPSKPRKDVATVKDRRGNILAEVPVKTGVVTLPHDLAGRRLTIEYARRL